MWLLDPYRFGDPDASAHIAAVEAADGQALEGGVVAAVQALVKHYKDTDLWSSCVQLIAPAGARSLNGSLLAIRGPNPTNNGFASGDRTRVGGLTGGGAKYLNSNFLANSLPANSHSLAWHGNLSATSGNPSVLGAWNGTNGSTAINLADWFEYAGGRGFLSGVTFPVSLFPVSTSTAAATCLVGARTAANNASIYVDGVETTNNTNVSTAFVNLPLFWFAQNVNGVSSYHSQARLSVGAIFSSGLNATQAAAFRTAGDNYAAALAAAIP